MGEVVRNVHIIRLQCYIFSILSKITVYFYSELLKWTSVSYSAIKKMANTELWNKLWVLLRERSFKVWHVIPPELWKRSPKKLSQIQIFYDWTSVEIAQCNNYFDLCCLSLFYRCWANNTRGSPKLLITLGVFW